jgi:hypothetical protein
MWWPNFWRNKLFIFFVLILLVGTAKGEETIITTGVVPLDKNLVEARQEALDAALAQVAIKVLKTLFPSPEEIVKKNFSHLSSLIQSYSIIKQSHNRQSYFVQIEAEINWEGVAQKLSNLGLIKEAKGEKILLFFTLPKDIEFKTQILSFWRQFFLCFGFNPFYKEDLEGEKIDYALKKGVPFILNFSVETISSSIGKVSLWDLIFTTEILYTTCNEVVFKGRFEERIIAKDIEGLIQTILDVNQNIAYEITPKLSAWFSTQKQKEFIDFNLIFNGISGYKEIFEVWENIENIKGIREILLKGVTANKVVYRGSYKGLMPNLVNQLKGLGFTIYRVKKNTIYLDRD